MDGSDLDLFCNSVSEKKFSFVFCFWFEMCIICGTDINNQRFMTPRWNTLFTIIKVCIYMYNFESIINQKSNSK